jgi:hypothetical protein
MLVSTKIRHSTLDNAKRNIILPRILLNSLTPYNRMFLENLMVVKLVKKSPKFYGNRRFIAWFKRATTGTYPEPRESSTFAHTITSRHFNIILLSMP